MWAGTPRALPRGSYGVVPAPPLGHRLAAAASAGGSAAGNPHPALGACNRGCRGRRARCPSAPARPRGPGAARAAAPAPPCCPPGPRGVATRRSLLPCAHLLETGVKNPQCLVPKGEGACSETGRWERGRAAGGGDAWNNSAIETGREAGMFTSALRSWGQRGTLQMLAH